MKTLPPAQLAAAAADPKHPQHHFAWGQLVGVALFGLAGFEGGPAVFESPQFLGQFIAGVSSLFKQPPLAEESPAERKNLPAPSGTQLG